MAARLGCSAAVACRDRRDRPGAGRQDRVPHLARRQPAGARAGARRCPRSPPGSRGRACASRWPRRRERGAALRPCRAISPRWPPTRRAGRSAPTPSRCWRSTSRSAARPRRLPAAAPHPARIARLSRRMAARPAAAARRFRRLVASHAAPAGGRRRRRSRATSSPSPRGLPASAPADEALAATGHRLYRDTLHRLRDEAGLAYLQPGRFLMPAPGAGAALDGVLPVAPAAARSRRLLAQRYDAYVDAVRRDLASPLFGRRRPAGGAGRPADRAACRRGGLRRYRGRARRRGRRAALAVLDWAEALAALLQPAPAAARDPPRRLRRHQGRPRRRPPARQPGRAR